MARKRKGDYNKTDVVEMSHEDETSRSKESEENSNSAGKQTSDYKTQSRSTKKATTSQSQSRVAFRQQEKKDIKYAWREVDLKIDFSTHTHEDTARNELNFKVEKFDITGVTLLGDTHLVRNVIKKISSEMVQKVSIPAALNPRTGALEIKTNLESLLPGIKDFKFLIRNLVTEVFGTNYSAHSDFNAILKFYLSAQEGSNVESFVAAQQLDEEAIPIYTKQIRVVKTIIYEKLREFIDLAIEARSITKSEGDEILSQYANDVEVITRLDLELMQVLLDINDQSSQSAGMVQMRHLVDGNLSAEFLKLAGDSFDFSEIPTDYSFPKWLKYIDNYRKTESQNAARHALLQDYIGDQSAFILSSDLKAFLKYLFVKESSVETLPVQMMTWIGNTFPEFGLASFGREPAVLSVNPGGLSPTEVTMTDLYDLKAYNPLAATVLDLFMTRIMVTGVNPIITYNDLKADKTTIQSQWIANLTYIDEDSIEKYFKFVHPPFSTDLTHFEKYFEKRFPYKLLESITKREIVGSPFDATHWMPPKPGDDPSIALTSKMLTDFNYNVFYIGMCVVGEYIRYKNPFDKAVDLQFPTSLFLTENSGEGFNLKMRKLAANINHPNRTEARLKFTERINRMMQENKIAYDILISDDATKTLIDPINKIFTPANIADFTFSSNDPFPLDIPDNKLTYRQIIDFANDKVWSKEFLPMMELDGARWSLVGSGTQKQNGDLIEYIRAVTKLGKDDITPFVSKLSVDYNRNIVGDISVFHKFRYADSISVRLRTVVKASEFQKNKDSDFIKYLLAKGKIEVKTITYADELLNLLEIPYDFVNAYRRYPLVCNRFFTVKITKDPSTDEIVKVKLTPKETTHFIYGLDPREVMTLSVNQEDLEATEEEIVLPARDLSNYGQNGNVFNPYPEKTIKFPDIYRLYYSEDRRLAGRK